LVGQADAALRHHQYKLEKYFSEYDKNQILNNQITATLNHVPFEFE